MAWRVFGKRFVTADFGSLPSVYQPFILDDNTALKAIRANIIIYNDPVFTSVSMRIYSNDNDVPKVLIAQSTNSFTKAQMHTEDNALKGLYFEFNKVPLRGGDTYHAAIWLSGYTGDADSHVGWKRGVPDPINPEGVTVSFSTLYRTPFDVAFYGGRL